MLRWPRELKSYLLCSSWEGIACEGVSITDSFVKGLGEVPYVVLVAMLPELWKGFMPLPRTIACFGAAAAEMIFIGKILRSAMVPFSHGLSRRVIISVLPALLALNENICFPGTPTIPDFSLPLIKVEFKRLR